MTLLCTSVLKFTDNHLTTIVSDSEFMIVNIVLHRSLGPDSKSDHFGRDRWLDSLSAAVEGIQGKEKGKNADHRKDGMMTLEKWQVRCGTEWLNIDQNGKGWRRPLPIGKQIFRKSPNNKF
ncbi:hypothetical protein EVAR_4692_1 [Eumeta japonica]|uniref:Uncharacterized protein n=1 Tax=Eumeta variegata TaxID=151549 RepID=A0A4C1WPZ7_EUMVA|nr:hypothetical protein EVAR_4692_1 [Eumeta japonica]